MTNMTIFRDDMFPKFQQRLVLGKNNAGAPKVAKSLYSTKGEASCYTRRINSISSKFENWVCTQIIDIKIVKYMVRATFLMKPWNDLTDHMVILPKTDRPSTRNLVRILILMVKIQKYNKNTVIGVPLCIFRKFHCSIVYKQWKTIENNRKTMGTIYFRNFLCANENNYYFKYTDQIWCYYHHYSPFYG